jgi:hypothetical protein
MGNGGFFFADGGLAASGGNGWQWRWKLGVMARAPIFPFVLLMEDDMV